MAHEKRDENARTAGDGVVLLASAVTWASADKVPSNGSPAAAKVSNDVLVESGTPIVRRTSVIWSEVGIDGGYILTCQCRCMRIFRNCRETRESDCIEVSPALSRTYRSTMVAITGWSTERSARDG